MSTRNRRAWLVFALLIGAALPAGAVDTWQPYPEGPKALEFYVARYGYGQADKAARGLAVTVGPAWGLDTAMHAYCFATLRDNDRLEGGLDWLSLGLFRNLKDGALKLDIYGELSAAGLQLDQTKRLVGLELNLDGQVWGLYSRPSYQWSKLGVDDDGEALIGRLLRVSSGLILQAGPSAQFLGEIVHERPKGYPELPETWELTGYAFGLNRIVTKTMELILEARTVEPAAGEKRIWDFTLGAVTVW